MNRSCTCRLFKVINTPFPIAWNLCNPCLSALNPTDYFKTPIVCKVSYLIISGSLYGFSSLEKHFVFVCQFGHSMRQRWSLNGKIVIQSNAHVKSRGGGARVGKDSLQLTADSAHVKRGGKNGGMVMKSFRHWHSWEKVLASQTETWHQDFP